MIRFQGLAGLLALTLIAWAPVQAQAQGTPPPGIPLSAPPAGNPPVVSDAPPPPAAPAPALPAGLDISSQVDRSEITIGDRIQYEIKVVYPAEGRVELPSVIGNLGSFEVKEFQASEPKLAGKLKIQTWRFNLSTFTVGEYMIPPQLVVYLPPGAILPASLSGTGAPEDTSTAKGPRPLVFNTQPIEIKVIRTSAETVQDIADIAPLAAPARDNRWPLYGGIGLALAILIGAWFWWRRRRKHGAAAAAEKPLLPPFEEAMESLAGLQPAALIRQNRARELCFALSGTLRRYISRRYEVDALESTTTEFMLLVPKLPTTQDLRQWVGRFCEATDMVKFANAPMLESEGEELLQGLKDFLNRTKPREVEGKAP